MNMNKTIIKTIRCILVLPAAIAGSTFPWVIFILAMMFQTKVFPILRPIGYIYIIGSVITGFYSGTFYIKWGLLIADSNEKCNKIIVVILSIFSLISSIFTINYAFDMDKHWVFTIGYIFSSIIFLGTSLYYSFLVFKEGIIGKDIGWKQN